ncbi:hypothetical protein R3P38DRAFT_3579219, partial [Favolaschia claudopus]
VGASDSPANSTKHLRTILPVPPRHSCFGSTAYLVRTTAFALSKFDSRISLPLHSVPHEESASTTNPSQTPSSSQSLPHLAGRRSLHHWQRAHSTSHRLCSALCPYCASCPTEPTEPTKEHLSGACSPRTQKELGPPLGPPDLNSESACWVLSALPRLSMFEGFLETRARTYFAPLGRTSCYGESACWATRTLCLRHTTSLWLSCCVLADARRRRRGGHRTRLVRSDPVQLPTSPAASRRRSSLMSIFFLLLFVLKWDFACSYYLPLIL